LPSTFSTGIHQVSGRFGRRTPSADRRRASSYSEFWNKRSSLRRKQRSDGGGPVEPFRTFMRTWVMKMHLRCLCCCYEVAP